MSFGEDPNQSSLDCRVRPSTQTALMHQIAQQHLWTIHAAGRKSVHYILESTQQIQILGSAEFYWKITTGSPEAFTLNIYRTYMCTY